MDKKAQKLKAVRIMIFAIIMIVIIVAMRLVAEAGSTSTKYVGFAQCLADKGVKLYGAFWCPHCQAEKSKFGVGAKYLNYVECSTPDGKSTTQICLDDNVPKWPTWVFPDGSRLLGNQSLSTLAAKSGCSLTTPQTQSMTGVLPVTH